MDHSDTRDAPDMLDLTGHPSDEWMSDGRLARVHFGVLLLVYGIYGYQVCPFLEQLNPVELIGPAAVMLAVQLGLRTTIHRLCAPLALHDKVRALFWGDLSLFALSGATLALFNLMAFGFPLESGFKSLLAFVSVGFYISLDLAFQREFQLGRVLQATGRAFPIASRFMPYQQKFVLFSTINLLVLASICILVIYKDLIWTTETSPRPEYAQFVIMAEVLFVVGVLAAYILRVIHQFSRNINASIEGEHRALRTVQAGDLDAHAPIMSNDEFGHMAALTNRMIERLKASIREIETTRDVTIMSLIALTAKRDNETGMHIRRTQTYVAKLAGALRSNPKYRDAVTDELIALLYKSTPLHDIGKVGIPDSILQKNGRLDDDEFEVMKSHTVIGAEALAEAEEVLGGSSFLALAREIAATHHERWDGSGYPAGLSGTEIPLSGRLMAVADVYDALRSRRVYKPAFSHDDSVAIILEGRGAHFDPDIVDAFVSVAGDIERISRQFGDGSEPVHPADEKPGSSGEERILAASDPGGQQAANWPAHATPQVSGDASAIATSSPVR